MTDHTCAECRRLPAWLVLNTVTDAMVDHRWGQYDPSVGGTEADWLAAKEGDFIATRDEMADALSEMERHGWLALDWDAVPPAVQIIRAEHVSAECRRERGVAG